MAPMEKAIVLTAEQLMERLDAGAQERLGMTGSEMVSAYAQGRLPDASRVADLLVLADLLPPSSGRQRRAEPAG